MRGTWVDLLREITTISTKRRVFVSYHHGNRFLPGDQYWADSFRDLFDSRLDVLYDHSVAEPVSSDDLEYVNRVIREDFITGSSVTVLLCGLNTWKRKCVDWEIYSTLYQRHALLGIALPTAERDDRGQIQVLDRLYSNWLRGYAGWMEWTVDPVALTNNIEAAIARSKVYDPDNHLPKMPRNLT
jgi:hypothetical protein